MVEIRLAMSGHLLLGGFAGDRIVSMEPTSQLENMKAAQGSIGRGQFTMLIG